MDAPHDPLMVTMSGPNVVRVLVFPGAHAPGVFVDGSAEGGEANAWCLLDSVRLAYEKDGRSVPLRVRAALALLRTPDELVRR